VAGVHCHDEPLYRAPRPAIAPSRTCSRRRRAHRRAPDTGITVGRPSGPAVARGRPRGPAPAGSLFALSPPPSAQFGNRRAASASSLRVQPEKALARPASADRPSVASPRARSAASRGARPELQRPDLVAGEQRLDRWWRPRSSRVRASTLGAMSVSILRRMPARSSLRRSSRRIVVSICAWRAGGRLRPTPRRHPRCTADSLRGNCSTAPGGRPGTPQGWLDRPPGSGRTGDVGATAGATGGNASPSAPTADARRAGARAAAGQLDEKVDERAVAVLTA